MSENMVILFVLVCNYYQHTVLAAVSTECGKIEGQYVNGAYSFRGIPYAEPPVGERRWKPPQTLHPSKGNCWNGTFPAHVYGKSCFQVDPDAPSRFLGSEDCLYLNVITPTLQPGDLRPVMVWIHGGSLQMSSGSWPLYSPTEELTNSTDIVYVGFNYRLQAFGFMALQELADQSPTNTSGNYGFMDMIAVLQWVQTNIRNFGGDPNQVTVFGQSSGGTAIFALLASPLCQGLFHKAWLLSASPILNKTSAEAFKDNEVFMQRSGCQNSTCLYSLSSEEVTRAVPWDVYPYWEMSDQSDLPLSGHFDGAIAVVDGYVLPEAPFVAWANGNGIDVPLLIGTCANEVDFMPFDFTISNWTWTQYKDHVTTKMNTFSRDIAQNLLKLYPTDSIDVEYQLTSMISDIRANCPNDVMALQASTYFKSPVYRYVVTYWPSSPVHAVGIPFPAKYSFHMLDIFGFFGLMPDYIKTLQTSDLEFQRNIQNEVLTFVKTGHPAFINYSTYPEMTLILTTETGTQNAYNPVHCEYLLMNGFFDYAWIN